MFSIRKILNIYFFEMYIAIRILIIIIEEIKKCYFLSTNPVSSPMFWKERVQMPILQPSVCPRIDHITSLKPSGHT